MRHLSRKVVLVVIGDGAGFNAASIPNAASAEAVV